MTATPTFIRYGDPPDLAEEVRMSRESARPGSRRFRSREGDSWWQTVLHGIIGSPAILKTVVGLGIGSAIGVAFMRFTVLDQVTAQDATHRQMIEAVRDTNRAVSAALAQEIQANRRTIEETSKAAASSNRGICLQVSKRDQELGDMDCPPNLYRGAEP